MSGAIEAELPDGTILEFPAGTPQEVIQRTVRRQLGVSEQREGGILPAWAPTAAARGVGDLLGLPRDIGNMGRSASAGALEQMNRQGVPERPIQAPWPFNLIHGEQPNRAQMVEQLRAANAAPGILPTGERAAAGVMEAAGITPVDPQTAAGRIGAEGVRFAAGSALGLTALGALRNAGMGGVAGLSSGTAGEAARGTSAEGPARIAGALAPAAIGGVAAVVRGNPVRDAAAALEGVTPQQMDAARALMAEAERVGSPITLAEAVQQVAGPNRNLRAAQDLAQTTVGGQRVMNPFLDQRDAGARRAASEFADSFAPVGPNAPMIPARVQEAAQAEVQAAMRARSEAVAPLYAQAAADAQQPGVRGAVRGIVFNAMTRLEAAAARDQSGILRPQFEQMAARFRAPFDPANPQPMDWESMQDARRYIRDVMRAQAQPGQPVIDRKVAAQALSVIEGMTDRLQRAVPSLKAADQEYIRLTREVVEPVSRGIVGRVADTDSAVAQRGLLFPRSPMGGEVPTTPEAAGNAMAQIAGSQAQRRTVRIEEMEGARGLLGAELRTRLDEAFAARASGPNERPGAAAAARLTPTEGREDALVAAFRALPGGQQAAAGFQRLMNVLEAQQFAPPTNSRTAQRTEMAQRAGGGARAAANPVGEFKRFVEDWSRNANTESLARALTTPEGFNMLRALAGIQGPEAAERLIGRILTYERARRAGEAEY